MAALSIQLSDDLAIASQHAAQKLGVSRSHFIRQAIEHELQSFQERSEREAMAKSMVALRKSQTYLEESEELDELLHSSLPEEQDQWWTK